MTKSEDLKVEQFYMTRAVEFIDCLYDKGYFKEDVKRDEMRGLDNLLGFMFQSQCNMAIKSNELLRRIKQ